MNPLDALKFAGGKQGAGVVGKICTVAIFAFIALAIGLYSMPGGTEKAVAVLVGMGIVATLLVWLVRQLLKYAENHPEEALMEGSDLLALKMRLLDKEQASSLQPPKIPTANVAPPQSSTSNMDDPK